MTEITESWGYKQLYAAAEQDSKREWGAHDFFAKVRWAVGRAQHYAEKTGLGAADILNAWETNRNYWYMNYYQDSNQPLIAGGQVRVFDTTEQLVAALGDRGFRCPACGGVSTNPYECDSGDSLGDRGVCDWKVYGLMSYLGRDVYVFVKDVLRGERIFMPIAWEEGETAVH